MSVDDHGERCPTCRTPGPERLRWKGNWYLACDGCGRRDHEYDLAVAALRRERRKETKK